MRKIVKSPLAHQLVVVMTLAALAGCGGDQDAQEQAAPGPARLACAVSVDASSLHGFYDLVDRVQAGEAVPVEEFGRLAATPRLERWRRSFQPENITAAWAGRMMFIALQGRDALPDRLRDKTVGMELVRAYEVAVERRADIEATAAALASGDLLCRVREELQGWLPASELPETLHVDLMVGYPEIRLLEDHLMLDGGLAWAAGETQLPRFLASILYKDLADRPGRDPDKAGGDAIFLESLRLVANLVAPSMIEHMDQIVFDRRHPLMSGASPTQETICDQAYRTLLSLDPLLTRVRGLESPTDDDWASLYRLFVGAQSWRATAWFMGTVIDERLGRDRLQQAVKHPADIIAAYQEAVGLGDGNSDAPRETYRWYLDTAPGFSAENQAWLETRLREHFAG